MRSKLLKQPRENTLTRVPEGARCNVSSQMITVCTTTCKHTLIKPCHIRLQTSMRRLHIRSLFRRGMYIHIYAYMYTYICKDVCTLFQSMRGH